MVGMKRIQKPDHMNDKYEAPCDDLAFTLWKAELNKELLAFWKALTKE